MNTASINQSSATAATDAALAEHRRQTAASVPIGSRSPPMSPFEII